MKGYLKQQLKTGYFAVKVYFKNRDGLKGDNINPPTMILQPIALCVLCIFAVAYLLTSTMAYAILGVVPILLLFSVEMYRAFAVGKNPLVVLLVILYFVRLPMWILGAAWGMINDGVVRFRGALKVQNYI